MPIAVFGSKTFSASGLKVYTFGNLSINKSINTEAVEVEGNKPSTFIKGMNLESIAFEVQLKSQFVNVKAEIDSWSNILKSKVPYPFLLGDSLVGDNKWLLKSLDISNTVIGSRGELFQATLSIKLEEFVRSGRPKDNEQSALSVTIAPDDISSKPPPEYYNYAYNTSYKSQNKRTNLQAKAALSKREQYMMF